MTNGELIMQKAKQILAYCNTFTQDEVELSFLGEIDLEEESAKRAKEVIEKEMFGVKMVGTSKNNPLSGDICAKNYVSIVKFTRLDPSTYKSAGISWRLNVSSCDMIEISEGYNIDLSDIITLRKDTTDHFFFNKDGAFRIIEGILIGSFFI